MQQAPATVRSALIFGVAVGTIYFLLNLFFRPNTSAWLWPWCMIAMAMASLIYDGLVKGKDIRW